MSLTRVARRLSRSFFALDAATVARALLGTVVVHRVGGREQRARIVETEAYVGPHDLACHAAKGRTQRTEVMFGEAGHAYVYFVYGMHHMLNVVTGSVDDAQAVLLRAAEPLSGIEGSTRGPALLTRAMGITRAYDGIDVCAGARPIRDGLWFLEGAEPKRIVATPRIGVDYAKQWKDALLRFVDAESAWVSRRPGASVALARKRIVALARKSRVSDASR